MTRGRIPSNGNPDIAMTPPPHNNDDQDEVGVNNRLWRIEQRQLDIMAQLTTVRARQDEAARAADDWRYRLENMIKTLSEKKPNGTSGTRIYEFVIVALLGAVVALAGGKALTLAGILG